MFILSVSVSAQENRVTDNISDSTEIKNISLDEIIINSSIQKNNTSLNREAIGRLFFIENNASNFSRTLSKLSGVASIDIGAGASKPVIRGFGFNRVAVVDRGITQQDQQWGADHGLEIDQYDVDNVVVHKGPMSLQFGSDAIGGAIEIVNAEQPLDNIYYGDATFIGKSNNDLLGISVMNALKHNKWYFKARYTTQRYSDYRIPSDNFTYLTNKYLIDNKRLKNTAGKDENISGSVQYTNNKIETIFSVSNVYQKVGFFPGAHGIPDASRLQHDGSYRNIDFPRNNVNHFKLINNTAIKISPSFEWLFDIGYQDNHRQEWSYFHTHYDNQQPPAQNRDLELDFDLKTYSFGSKLLINKDSHFSHTIGLQTNWQQNHIKGYAFFLPQFNQFSGGAYYITNYKLNDKSVLNGGVRYDFSKIKITGYYDEVLAEYLNNTGNYTEDEVRKNAQRAYDLDKNFNGLSGSVGMFHRQDPETTWSVNLGTSFRYPTANELGANGMHHGAFRHEQGNPGLKTERGYQLDLGYNLDKKMFSFSISPFVSYFSNYIFLQPQGIWSILPHAGQLYRFQQAEALFAGGECKLKLMFIPKFEITTGGDYVYNLNIKHKHALPFTPPLSMRNEIAFSDKYKVLQSYRIAVEHQLFAAQNRISNNEDKTPGTNLFNFSLNANIMVDKMRFMAGFQIHNIFDTKYLNHLSFYRKLNIPEPGRNIQLLIKVPFYI